MKDFLYLKNVELEKIEKITPANSTVTSNENYVLVQSYHSSKAVENIENYAFSNMVSDSGLVTTYNEAKDIVIKGDGIYGSWIKVNKNNVKVRTDHLGAQKVYYFSNDNNTVITSSMKLMLEVLGELSIKYTLSKEQAILYLYARETKWPKTIINEVSCFLPSCNVTICDGVVSYEHYTISSSSEETPYTTLKNILSNLGNRKASSTLSGGVDSQCVTNVCKSVGVETAISCAYSSEKINNDYNCFNEIPYAKKFSEDISINLIEKKFTVDDVVAARKTLLQDIDQPTHDPTSFYLMCSSLGVYDIDTLISGMGGDAIFAPIKELNRARITYSIYYTLLKYLPKKLLHNICKIMGFRGPFNFLYQLLSNDEKINFFELIDLTRPYHYTSVVENAISKSAINEARNSYYSLNREFIFKNYDKHLSFFCVDVEWKLNAAVLLNPDEFNVESSSKKNNIRAIMPFAMPGFVNSCLQYKGLDRNTQMDLLKLSNRDCLISSKSGFTVPYEEWLIPLFMESINEFLVEKTLSDYLEVNTNYINKIMKCKNLNRSEAAFIQRIDTLYNYVKINNVSIPSV